MAHIDEGHLFRELAPPDSVPLDLMSGWRSRWPAGHAVGYDTFDAVTIAVLGRYLTHPVDGISEVNCILKPGGVFIAGFSNRMFSTKAMYISRKSRGQD